MLITRLYFANSKVKQFSTGKGIKKNDIYDM